MVEMSKTPYLTMLKKVKNFLDHHLNVLAASLHHVQPARQVSRKSAQKFSINIVDKMKVKSKVTCASSPPPPERLAEVSV